MKRQSLFFEKPNRADAVNSLEASKIEIIFDNERKLIHSADAEDNGSGPFSEPIALNVLRNGNYDQIDNSTFIYTISEEDYNNAIPCEGNCN